MDSGAGLSSNPELEEIEMKDHPFPYIEVSGNSYEMGYQHGAQAAGMVQRYLLWIEKLTGKPRELLCRNAMTFLPALQAAHPPLVEEVRGLAVGAGIALEEAMLCQVRAEAAQVAEGGCTAFALRGAATLTQSVLAGQNQDLETEYADVGILLHLRPSDGRPRALVFTFAGQLGYAGINEHGVCNFYNALYNFTWRPGLSNYMLSRMVLETHSVDDAIEVYRRHRACSAVNKVICDGRGEISSVEVRPEAIALFTDDHPDWLVHTNHYLTEEFKRHENGFLPDSPPRLARMRSLVKEQWGLVTVDALKEMLSDHEGDPAAICRHGEGHMHSISGYIAEPENRVLHVRRGHGCLGTWQTYGV